jgi:hypothetical protein
MEVLRGTLREVVALLPDEAEIKVAVPVRYAVGSLDAIFDVVVVIPQPVLPEPKKPAVSKAAPRTRAASSTQRSPRKSAA